MKRAYMKMIRLEVLDQRAMRPEGNPFGVKCLESVKEVSGCINIIRTGVKIELPDDLMLMVISAQAGLEVLGWNIDDQGLKITTIRDEALVEFKEPFAMAYVVEKKPVPIRFVEFTPEGKRVITGEPQKIDGAIEKT
jgi:hypothetical protein